MGLYRAAGLLGPRGEVEVLVFLGRLFGKDVHVAPCIRLVTAGEGRCGDGGRRGVGTSDESRANEAAGATTDRSRGGISGRGKHGSGRFIIFASYLPAFSPSSRRRSAKNKKQKSAFCFLRCLQARTGSAQKQKAVFVFALKLAAVLLVLHAVSVIVRIGFEKLFVRSILYDRSRRRRSPTAILFPPGYVLT